MRYAAACTHWQSNLLLCSPKSFCKVFPKRRNSGREERSYPLSCLIISYSWHHAYLLLVHFIWDTNQAVARLRFEKQISSLLFHHLCIGFVFSLVSIALLLPVVLFITEWGMPWFVEMGEQWKPISSGSAICGGWGGKPSFSFLVSRPHRLYTFLHQPSSAPKV